MANYLPPQIKPCSFGIRFKVYRNPLKGVKVVCILRPNTCVPARCRKLRRRSGGAASASSASSLEGEYLAERGDKVLIESIALRSWQPMFVCFEFEERVGLTRGLVTCLCFKFSLFFFLLKLTYAIFFIYLIFYVYSNIYFYPSCNI